MAETATISISKAVDMAVERLPWLRRVTLQRRLKNKAYREALEQEMACKCSEDEECCRLVPTFAALSAKDGFSTTQDFGIDPANLEKFLEIILKYLPQILELIFKFFSLAGFIAFSLVGQTAVAQCELVNGQWQCRTPVRNVVRGVSQSAVSVPLRVARAVVQPVRGYAAVSNVQSYGSIGTSAAVQIYEAPVQSYGSLGSAIIQTQSSPCGCPDCTCVNCDCGNMQSSPMQSSVQMTVGRRRLFGGSHQALVAESGIVPSQVGTHEGVGVSTVSFEDARNRACFWGRRQALSVQYSQGNGRFYAVVRYR